MSRDDGLVLGASIRTSGQFYRIIEGLVGVIGGVSVAGFVSRGASLQRGRGTVAVQGLESNRPLHLPWSRVWP